MGGLFAQDEKTFEEGVVVYGPLCPPDSEGPLGFVVMLDRGDSLQAHPTRVVALPLGCTCNDDAVEQVCVVRDSKGEISRGFGETPIQRLQDALNWP